MENSSTEQDHSLCLNIMRLVKPDLIAPPTSMGEQWDSIGRSLEAEVKKDISTNQSVPGVSISTVLELPPTKTPTVGNLIYLGETYRVYVALSNMCEATMRDVVLKVEVLTPAGNRHLLYQSPPLSEMPPKQRHDKILSHDVKEMGEHHISCSVNYTLQNAETKLLRQLQKFTVCKPLEVRPDNHFVDGDVLLTVQIQNVMTNPVTLESVTFEPVAGYSSVDLNRTDKDLSVFGDDNIFYPSTSRIYLYRITPNISSLTGTSKSVNIPVGKVDIVWRGRFGEKGRIQTGQLKAIVHYPPELEVKLIESPEKVELEKSFVITVSITNNSAKEMRLRSQLDRQPGSGVLWCDITCQTHAELEPGETIEVQFELLPISPGLQTIGPLHFVDIISRQKKYPIQKLGEVFVTSTHTPLPLLNSTQSSSITVDA